MTREDWPAWSRWLVRILALTVIAVGAFILYWAAPADTAGNAGIRFILELQGFQGGPEEAYDDLCSSEQSRIGRAVFLESEGAEYAPLATEGAVGAAAEYPDDTDTLGSDIQAAWVEYESSAAEGGLTWRLNLVRQRSWWQFRGSWKVCGIEVRA